MPNYEYRCRTCNETFELSLSMQQHEELNDTMRRGGPVSRWFDTERHCTTCTTPELKPVISTFTPQTAKKS